MHENTSVTVLGGASGLPGCAAANRSAYFYFMQQTGAPTSLFSFRPARLCRSIQSSEINSQILCFEKGSLLFFFCFDSFSLQTQVDVNNLCVLTPMAANGVGQLHGDLASQSNPRCARLPGFHPELAPPTPPCVPFLCETVLQLLKPVRPQSIGLIRCQKGEKRKKISILLFFCGGSGGCFCL